VHLEKLDVYDPAQTFRHHVTRLVLDSPCNLDTVLQISARFLDRPVDMDRRGLGPALLQAIMVCPKQPKSSALALRLIASFVLGRTLLYVKTPPEKWEHSFYGRGTPTDFDPPDFLEDHERQIWNSLILLISRLGNVSEQFLMHPIHCVLQQARS
jgi:hypothetical protein